MKLAIAAFVASLAWSISPGAAQNGCGSQQAPMPRESGARICVSRVEIAINRKLQEQHREFCPGNLRYAPQSTPACSTATQTRCACQFWG